MKFTEKALASLDLTTTTGVVHLVVKSLCGRKSCPYPQTEVEQFALVTRMVEQAQNKGLSYEQFNELLLMLHQDRVSRAFFDFFFGPGVAVIEDLRAGVLQFRGFAMLAFGGIRAAFRELSIIEGPEAIRGRLCPAALSTSLLKADYVNRPAKLLEIQEIRRDITWYVGEITGNTIERQLKDVAAAIESEPLGTQRRHELEVFFGKLEEMAAEYTKVQAIALQNTNVYLTWDFLDVYVATSMRYEWEYKDTYDLIKHVFSSDPISQLKLRHFDPTQSKCTNSRDKGLVEGLMLKRAKCTIYMAQENDTMGKDSELAATLAQGRPVIVYVPQIESAPFSERIGQFPLDYFYRRVLLLKAERIFDDADCTAQLAAAVPEYRDILRQFIFDYEEYRRTQPFALWREKDDELFKHQKGYFCDLCLAVAIAEKRAFDKRAAVLTGVHPLAMQVDLQSGVAVGVVVVRSAAECAEQLRRLLLNESSFVIDSSFGTPPDYGFTVLREEETGSHYRVVTHNEKLSNAFWNHFHRDGGSASLLPDC